MKSFNTCMIEVYWVIVSPVKRVSDKAMNTKRKNEIVAEIELLAAAASDIHGRDAEDRIVKILIPLLENDGFKVLYKGMDRNAEGLDFIASRGAVSLGIDFKHKRGGPITAFDIRTLIGTAMVHELDRIIMVCTSRFTVDARATAERIEPIAIELLDLDDLKRWSLDIEDDKEIAHLAIQVVKDFAKGLIELINRNPRVLDHIEWRDLERLLAEAMSGIGFDVTLTPGSKDGGKDLILDCTKKGTKESFIVEVKHWRSEQKVGQAAIKDLVKVIAKEKRDGGLFLSTYGFTENIAESLTEFERRKLRHGSEEKIVSICKTYWKKQSGLWNSDQDLPDILFHNTYSF